MMNIVFASGISFVISLIVVKLMLKEEFAGRVVDQPNERSLHAVPVPRSGGVGVMAGVLLAWGAFWHSWLGLLTGCVLLLMLVSFVDDLRGLPARWRFFAHFVAATTYVMAGYASEIPLAWTFPLILAVVWMTNLYNFMDGSDGLAGGMALFGFGTYTVAAILSAEFDMAAVVFVIAAGAAAFLLFNFHPAKIFMGDVGSIPLGFLAAALGILGWQRGIWPMWFPVLVFSPFIVDATTTLFKRVLRGEKIWQAHRSHYYQRMVQMGFGHRTTALYEYLLMLLVGMSALWGQRHSGGVAYMLGVWAVVYGVILFCIDSRWSSRSST